MNGEGEHKSILGGNCITDITEFLLKVETIQTEKLNII